MADHDTTISPETYAAIRESPTCLCWQRASDMPHHLRVLQGKFPSPSSPQVLLSYSAVFPQAFTPLRGVVVFVHGVNEHSERYFHLFEAVCGMGFGLIAYDLRSHGKSHMDVPGLIGHANRFQEFIDDTNDFVDFCKREIYAKMGINAHQDPKLIIMAMSMGTLVSVLTVLSERHAFAGIVLAAPAVSVQMTPCLNIMAGLGCVLSSAVPTARLVPGVNVKWLSRDPLVNAEYDSDPLTTRRPITCRMGHDTRQHMVALQRDTSVEDPASAFCAIPILLLMGSQDRVTSLPVAQTFYDRLGTQDKQFELIDGAYHVLFEDFERAHVLHTIQQWLYKRFPLPVASATRALPDVTLLKLETSRRLRARVDRTNNYGASPVCMAAFRGHARVIEYLLARGANVGCSMTNGASPLCVGALHGHARVVETLLAASARVDLATYEGDSPLYTAAQEAHVAIVEWLLAASARTDRATSGGFAPLFIAAERATLPWWTRCSRSARM